MDWFSVLMFRFPCPCHFLHQWPLLLWGMFSHCTLRSDQEHSGGISLCVQLSGPPSLPMLGWRLSSEILQQLMRNQYDNSFNDPTLLSLSWIGTMIYNEFWPMKTCWIPLWYLWAILIFVIEKIKICKNKRSSQMGFAGPQLENFWGKWCNFVHSD